MLLEHTPEARRRNRWLSGVVVALAVVVWLRPSPSATERPIVEIAGEGVIPGYYELDPTLGAALAAQGLEPAGWPSRGLRHGDRIEVLGDEIRVGRADEALALGLPVDINLASAEALATLPGLGPRRAEAVVEDRARRGPFDGVAELDRVKGIGPATVARLEAQAVAGAGVEGVTLRRAATSR